MTFLTQKYATGAYRLVSFKTKEYHVKLEEIMSSKQPVTSGNLFWKRVMQEVHNNSMQQLMYEQKYAWTYERDERPHVSVKKNWIPTMTWKNDALILQVVLEKGVAELQQEQGLDHVFHQSGFG